VVPDAGACAELWQEHAVLVPTRAEPHGGQVVDAEGVAAALARARSEPLLAERARALATSPRFDWSAIARRWEELLLR